VGEADGELLLPRRLDRSPRQSLKFSTRNNLPRRGAGARCGPARRRARPWRRRLEAP
jgi:hypothetical protein